MGPDEILHRCVLEHERPLILDEGLPDTQLFAIQIVDDYFQDIAQYLSIGFAPAEMTTQQKKQLVVRAANFTLISG